MVNSGAAVLLSAFLLALPVSLVEALQIDQVTFPEHVMLGQTVTLVCEYTVGQSGLDFINILPA
jgi:hypothetical protein